MEITQSNATTYCNLCYGVGTSRCGRCHNAYYCSREHQVSHWAEHKKVCRKQNPEVQNQVVNTQTVSSENMSDLSAYGGWCQNNLPYDKNNTVMESEDSYNMGSGDTSITADNIVELAIPTDGEVFSSYNSEVFSSDNNFWDLINSFDAQSIFDFGTDTEKEHAIAKISQALQTGAPTPQPNEMRENQQLLNDIENMGLMQGASLHDICSNVVHDLNTYGICVLDKFLGSNLGSKILAEVKLLYRKGIFQKGELVTSGPFVNQNIRNDVTTWVNGNEPNCSSIGSLIKKLDVVITTCNKLQNNGLLEKYKLHRRTKAMIACYPGDGTYYKKHIDNPRKDGRCITCIYYLNQNWKTQEHGGLLRMFPAAHDTQVANIEPIFDRMIFFWSDKRNPHEVLPSFATRFAITVWYFDADERDQALLMAKERSLKNRNQFRK